MELSEEFGVAADSTTQLFIGKGGARGAEPSRRSVRFVKDDQFNTRYVLTAGRLPTQNPVFGGSERRGGGGRPPQRLTTGYSYHCHEACLSSTPMS